MTDKSKEPKDSNPAAEVTETSSEKPVEVEKKRPSLEEIRKSRNTFGANGTFGGGKIGGGNSRGKGGGLTRPGGSARGR